MKIDILTIFPEMFENVLSASILKRAQDSEAVEIEVYDLRDWAKDKHRSVDDKPYGGGPGMVMKVDVIHQALLDLRSKVKSKKLENKTVRNNRKPVVVLLTPQGKRYEQKIAKEFSNSEHLILVAGHYEGFDERVRDYVDMEISIGDYVLTGGELPAMVVVDSVVRLLPGVVGNEKSVENESFSENLASNSSTSGDPRRVTRRGFPSKRLLDYPEYTRPAEHDGKKVPEILLSGDHARIEEWRRKKAKEKTKKRRPDLLGKKK